MRERPTGEELLAVALMVLREELMPHLPGDRRYDALMIANAMGIAARQLAFGNEPEREERNRLIDLLVRTGTCDRTTAEDSDLAELNHLFGTRIRGGEFDPGSPGHDSLKTFLLDTTIQRLRESSPKTLEVLPVRTCWTD